MSEKQIVFDNEFATIWYYPQDGIIHHYLKKYIYGESFREIMNKGLEIMREKRASKWLSDNRNNSALPREDSTWAETVWFPAVKAAGWKYWAVVMPEKMAGKLNMREFIASFSSHGFVAQAFDNPEEAVVWLQKQK